MRGRQGLAPCGAPGASSEPRAQAGGGREASRPGGLGGRDDLVEASTRVALARGLGGLLSRIARAVNRACGRRGPVFLDRYHARALGSPTEVRRVLVYLLTNYKKHEDPIPDPECQPRDGIDPCSSARWFDGWSRPPPPAVAPAPVVPPRTWMARRGWRHLGLLARREAPAAVLRDGVEVRLPVEAQG